MVISPDEALMVRRAAETVRNLIRQDPSRNTWADWVPRHLDGLAERIAAAAVPQEGSTP